MPHLKISNRQNNPQALLKKLLKNTNGLNPLPPVPRHKYPHFNKFDAQVWHNWITSSSGSFQCFCYDVRVGKGMAIKSHWEPEIAKMARDISQKRIDVVGFTNTRPWIFEVKTGADVTTPGQIIAYKKLFEEKYQPVRQSCCVLLYNFCDHDTLALCWDLGIHTIYVPPGPR